jgi:hypothetical protein
MAGTDDRRRCNRDLPERVGPAAGSAGSACLPAVPEKPMRHVEHAFIENSSLVDARTANDHLDDTVIHRGAAHYGRSSLDLGEWTMEGNMCGELLSHAGLDRAYEALPFDVSLGIGSS